MLPRIRRNREYLNEEMPLSEIGDLQHAIHNLYAAYRPHAM